MEGPVQVANFRTKLEAEIAAGLLEGAGIPYIIQSTEGILHGPISPGATILVSESSADHARAVLGKAEEAPPQDAA